MMARLLQWLDDPGERTGTIPLLLGVGIHLALMPLGGSVAIAQLTPDTASDRNLGTTVERSTGGTDRITGGARRGANLFHSFSEFNINLGQRVYFANPTGVENILSRVTGQNASTILGTLGVEGGANLFLLNPNGILFGPHAQLDIRGSFVASTASSFKFADGTEFSATNPHSPPLLAINLTPGLQYGSIRPGSTIVNRGNLSAGQNLTLVGDRLDLQGQLQAGRDLTLQAQDRVQIRDTAIVPFVAAAGNHLLVQGDQSVDIFALNHASSGFWSGRDLVLRSNNPIVGDAHFYAGRNLHVQRLDGTPGNLLSPHDPVILAIGNVSLGDYFGASLHILAGGSVTLGNVTIDSTGETTTTINPNNTTPFNTTKTFADLATVVLTDYQPIYSRDGSVQAVVPVATTMTIDGSNQATLDVRAGVDWAQLGGLPTSPTNLGTVIPEPEDVGVPKRADITVTGNIRVNQPDGLVLLTNQFYPNRLEGTIETQGIDTSTNISEANGGDIRLYGRGDVILGNPYSYSQYGFFVDASSNAFTGNAGNGGTISLSSYLGAISSYMPLYSTSYSYSGEAHNGGMISLTTNSGDINIINSSLYSIAQSYLGTTTGRGGDIFFATNSGNIAITMSYLNSYSQAYSGIAGRGGNISFATNSGNIAITTNSSLSSTSYSYLSRSDRGGDISLTTNSGNIVLTDAFLGSSSSTSGSGGDILLTTNSGNIVLSFSGLYSGSFTTDIGGDIFLTTNSGDISFVWSSTYSGSGTTGTGGNISFTTDSGDISLISSSSDSSSYSSSNATGTGGNISFTTNSGDISLTNSGFSSYSFVYGGDAAGNGGDISITTNFGNILLTNSNLFSFSLARGGHTAGNGGDISLMTTSGNIIGSASSLASFAVSTDSSSTSGDGGNVTLTAKNQISGLDVFTQSSSETAGEVNIVGTGDLKLSELEVSTSKTVAIKVPIANEIITFTPGERGRSGAVTIIGAGNLTFDGTLIQSTAQGIDPAGDVQITSPGVVTFNNSQIISNTNSSGQAGSIGVTAGEGITLTNNSQISARTSNVGSAGDITLNAPILTVAGNAQVLAETAGSGQGGSILVNAPIAVNLTRVRDFSPVLSVEASDAGKAGNIVINTPSLTLADLARITATSTATATNPAGGGSITLNASNLYLAGIVGVFAETQGQTPAGSLTLNPYANQSDLNVVLAAGSRISASTFASGNGGDLRLAAPRSMTLAGPGQLAVETSGMGNAGNITLTTEQLILQDGIEISASTSGSGKAGDIAIHANGFTISQGARVSTNTTSTGQAGNITVTVPEQITLTGQGTGLFASTTSGSTGNGGNIIIDPQYLLIEAGAAIAVDSQGTGQGGNITIQSNRLELRDSGSITAQTASNQGGNITLNVQDLRIVTAQQPDLCNSGHCPGGGGWR
ncbi:filamentous hemagglutinin N-terminal domain-containing protein (plasmid) [Kovacikia minuta CCNUW1]|uniref:two-partner secretion domain-containing protein n=1 Tax=Kovacikia minuta TaxID=2931930 RepID=UPI001CCD3604|nr:filamentous hemagglutinin N-terminal domain-containing protein [Kovacikia minuta]UBF30427.1 filamentous hemagglutinin N-terminal domain-containing protein [Kovacikia minuta CCNUW1]